MAVLLAHACRRRSINALQMEAFSKGLSSRPGSCFLLLPGKNGAFWIQFRWETPKGTLGGGDRMWFWRKGPKVGGQGFISEPGLSREPAVWESDPGTGRGELPRGWRAQGQRVAVGRGGGEVARGAGRRAGKVQCELTRGTLAAAHEASRGERPSGPREDAGSVRRGAGPQTRRGALRGVGSRAGSTTGAGGRGARLRPGGGAGAGGGKRVGRLRGLHFSRRRR